MDGITAEFAVYYGELIEDEGGLYRLGGMLCLDASEITLCPMPEQVRALINVVRAFTHLMMDRGWDGCELPNTTRTQTWVCGPLFSVAPTGGESRLYAVIVVGCLSKALKESERAQVFPDQCFSPLSCE